MNPQPRNLAEDLDHPLYEMEMMHKTAVALGWPDVRKEDKTEDETTTANALLESFVIHARCLQEFFERNPAAHKKKKGKPGKKREHRMRAVDFAAGFPLAKPHPEIRRMHEEVAHLCLTRKKPGERRGWDIARTIQPLAEISTEFLKQILRQPELRDFRENRARSERLLNIWSPQNRFLFDVQLQADTGTSAPVQLATLTSAYRTVAMTRGPTV